MEIDIGRGKKGRRAYGFDDIAIVPSRRTRDPDDIDISWTLGPYRFELPLVELRRVQEQGQHVAWPRGPGDAPEGIGRIHCLAIDLEQHGAAFDASV